MVAVLVLVPFVSLGSVMASIQAGFSPWLLALVRDAAEASDSLLGRLIEKILNFYLRVVAPC
jgi:hypothetical protein